MISPSSFLINKALYANNSYPNNPSTRASIKNSRIISLILIIVSTKHLDRRLIV